MNKKFRPATDEVAGWAPSPPSAGEASVKIKPPPADEVSVEYESWKGWGEEAFFSHTERRFIAKASVPQLK